MRIWAKNLVDALTNPKRARSNYQVLSVRSQLFHQVANENADYDEGHVVWAQTGSETESGNEGRFQLLAEVNLDFRASTSLAVEALRDRVLQELDRIGAIIGGGDEVWLYEDKPKTIHRAIVSLEVDPYFSLPAIGAHEFGPSFGPSFDI